MISTLKSKRLRPIQIVTAGILTALMIAYIGVVILADPTAQTARQFWPFSLVGIGGALVAILLVVVSSSPQRPTRSLHARYAAFC